MTACKETPCPSQTCRSQGSSGKPFSLTITLSLVLFFMFSSFLHPPALCPLLPSHSFQCGLFSFHPQPCISFILWLTVQNYIPSREQQFSIFGELLTGLCQQSTCMSSMIFMSPAFCIRWREPRFMEYGPPL